MATEAKPHPITMIENVQLEAFEKAVYTRDHEHAGHLLLVALRRLKAGADFIGYVPDPRVKTVLYTRFCAAVVALIADPKFMLSQEGFDHLASEHAVTDLLFRASAFETSDHLLPQIAANPTEPTAKLRLTDGAGVLKFLLTYSLRSGFALNFEETFRRSPQVTFALWAGMISPLLTTAVQAQDRREALLGMHGLFAAVKPSDAILPTLSDSYMYTSYGLRRDKHDAKATMHRLFAQMFVDRGIKLPTEQDLADRRATTIASGDKPTILICIEWFTSLHAMYRCYAPIIRQLRTRFRLVGMSREMDIDEIGKAEFDEWHQVPAQLSIEDLVAKVTCIAPDIIYHPSIGMAMWWVVLASVRLAPIQLMTLGHPASSRSPCMDYVLCDEGAIGDPALFTEKIVEYPNGSARFIMRPDAEFPEALREDAPETVHIAVPAMLCKLNATFLRTLSEIKAQAGRQVEFHFFVNMLGINLHQAAREIRDWLPNDGDRIVAKIYERTAYNQYLNHLRQCHLHLCTFPFGGTNSNIDSMILGIPLVALLGDEPHERFDAMMIRRAGLPESLVAKSRDDYVAEAVRLIGDDGARNALRDHLLGFDLQGEFFGEPPEDRRTAFVDTMTRIYVTHGGSADGSGTEGAAPGSEGPNGGGRGRAGEHDALVPFAGQVDRTGRHAEGLGGPGRLPAEARS